MCERRIFMAHEEKRLTLTSATQRKTPVDDWGSKEAPTGKPETVHRATPRRSIFEPIRNWWDSLVDPTKVRRVTKTEALRNSRDSILIAVLMCVSLLVVRKVFPTLFVGLGMVEVLCMFMTGLEIRDAIANNESFRAAQRHAERASGRLIRSYLLGVIVLTALAVWIKSGVQWANDFPLLQTFAEKQIGMVNETLEWFTKVF